MKTSKKDYLSCMKSNCRSCGIIQDCIERKNNFTACINNPGNKMCAAAQKTYGLLIDDDIVNYNYHACKESCWISGDD